LRPGPRLAPLELTEGQHAELNLLKVCGNARLAARARIVLACTEGLSILEVARREETTATTVRKWRDAFLSAGVGELADTRRQGRPKDHLQISDEDRALLERYVRRGTASQRLSTRARIILRCAEGRTNKEVAEFAGVTGHTVGKWRRRFVELGVDGLTDSDRPGVPRKITDDMVEDLIVKTLESTPKGATHWSTRSMAKRTGISNTSVGRIWRALGLQPHRTETFQLSTDPHFVEKVRDVVGLYMDPPDNALVLCVDEKSQIQALNRTQPLLPLRPGQVERGTPEYQRNGTTTLFAALDRATGNIIGKCYPRHRAVEFRKFLNEIRRSVPPDVEVHIVVDNYATHAAPTVRRWFAKNHRFHLHFIPTHSSWLNQVEGWFSILTTKQIKRGSHNSVRELKTSIQEFLDAWNEDPTPFTWTKTADRVLENLARSCHGTLETHSD
jgi:transposase